MQESLETREKRDLTWGKGSVQNVSVHFDWYGRREGELSCGWKFWEIYTYKVREGLKYQLMEKKFNKNSG